jgi:cell division septum initiation protein DivIVA
MDMNIQKELETLKEQIELLKTENNELKERLKKYTSPARSKTYYQNHKEEIKKKVKECREKTNYVASISPEKKKEYNRIAYLNRKKKLNEINNMHVNIT